MKKIVATNGTKYIGVCQKDDKIETCIVDTARDALSYKIVILPFIKKKILKQLEERFDEDFYFKKIEIVLEEEVNVYNK